MSASTVLPSDAYRMVSAGTGFVTSDTSGRCAAYATYDGDAMIRLGTAMAASRIMRIVQPVGRERRRLLTVRVALARRRDPFGLRGQSVSPFPLVPIFVYPPVVARHGVDAAEPVDLRSRTDLVQLLARLLSQGQGAPSHDFHVDDLAELAGLDACRRLAEPSRRGRHHDVAGPDQEEGDPGDRRSRCHRRPDVEAPVDRVWAVLGHPRRLGPALARHLHPVAQPGPRLPAD